MSGLETLVIETTRAKWELQVDLDSEHAADVIHGSILDNGKLMSKGIDWHFDPDDGIGIIYVGGCRAVGQIRTKARVEQDEELAKLVGND